MHQLTFYVDFISPYAYLAFHALPKALEGLSYQVRYQPILFGAVLQHHGQLGPAEIPAKRLWTYRQVLWLAQQQGCPLRMPASHPYNPLGLLRATKTDIPIDMFASSCLNTCGAKAWKLPTHKGKWRCKNGWHHLATRIRMR
jgi:2-hydroxychromene-2-carboxylate isomerase